MVWKTRIDVTRWLFHVNMYLQTAIEECIFDIKLSKRPAMSECNREDYTNSGCLDHWIERVINVIEARKLIVSLCNESGFQTFHRTIKLAFCSEDPLAANNIGLERSWDKIPSAVIIEGFDLIIVHSSQPFWMLCSRLESARGGG